MPWWGILLIVLGSLLVLGGILAAVAVPAFIKYLRRAKTTEAPANLKRIFDGAKAYYESQPKVDRTGQRLDPRFPASAALTPKKPCCERAGERCRGTRWEHPTWRALSFDLDHPHYFQYRFESAGAGAEALFTAGAHADLDCDGIFSTFERTGRANAGGQVVGPPALHIVNRHE